MDLQGNEVELQPQFVFRNNQITLDQHGPDCQVARHEGFDEGYKVGLLTAFAKFFVLLLVKPLLTYYCVNWFEGCLQVQPSYWATYGLLDWLLAFIILWISYLYSS